MKGARCIISSVNLKIKVRQITTRSTNELTISSETQVKWHMSIFSYDNQHLVDELYTPGMTKEEGKQIMLNHPDVVKNHVRSCMHNAINEKRYIRVFGSSPYYDPNSYPKSMVLPATNKKNLVDELYTRGMCIEDGENAIKLYCESFVKENHNFNEV